MFFAVVSVTGLSWTLDITMSSKSRSSAAYFHEPAKAGRSYRSLSCKLSLSKGQYSHSIPPHSSTSCTLSSAAAQGGAAYQHPQRLSLGGNGVCGDEATRRTSARCGSCTGKENSLDSYLSS